MLKKEYFTFSDVQRERERARITHDFYVDATTVTACQFRAWSEPPEKQPPWCGLDEGGGGGGECALEAGRTVRGHDVWDTFGRTGTSATGRSVRPARRTSERADPDAARTDDIGSPSTESLGPGGRVWQCSFRGREHPQRSRLWVLRPRAAPRRRLPCGRGPPAQEAEPRATSASDEDGRAGRVNGAGISPGDESMSARDDVSIDQLFDLGGSLASTSGGAESSTSSPRPIRSPTDDRPGRRAHPGVGCGRTTS